MNVFNRVVIILLIIVLMIVIPLALLFPEQAEGVLRYGADVIRLNLQWLSSQTPAAQVGIRLLLAAIALIVFLIGVLLLILEVVRLRRTTVRMRQGSGELMMDGVAQHLADHVDALPDVVRVRPEVFSRGDRVRVALYVETAPGVNIPSKSTEIMEKARQVIEDQMGLRLDGNIRVVIRPVAYPKVRGKPAPAPAEEAQPGKPQVVTEAAPPEPGMEGYTPPMEAPGEPGEESQTLEAKGPAPEENKEPEA
jgi:uncharacterized alkaline shock family protein YloU